MPIPSRTSLKNRIQTPSANHRVRQRTFSEADATSFHVTKGKQVSKLLQQLDAYRRTRLGRPPRVLQPHPHSFIASRAGGVVNRHILKRSRAHQRHFPGGRSCPGTANEFECQSTLAISPQRLSQRFVFSRETANRCRQHPRAANRRDDPVAQRAPRTVTVYLQHQIRSGTRRIASRIGRVVAAKFPAYHC